MMTEQALREQLKTETKRNIFVTAGAGAGKSTLMIDRLIYQTKRGTQSFDQTVAITFTEKAANELEEKLMETLMREGEEALLHKKEALTLGTIHSFCRTLLEERPLDVGLSVDFHVLDEREDAALRATVLQQYVNEKRETSTTLEPWDIVLKVVPAKKLTTTLQRYMSLSTSHIPIVSSTTEESISAEAFAQLLDTLNIPTLQLFRNDQESDFLSAIEAGEPVDKLLSFCTKFGERVLKAHPATIALWQQWSDRRDVEGAQLWLDGTFNVEYLHPFLTSGAPTIKWINQPIAQWTVEERLLVLLQMKPKHILKQLRDEWERINKGCETFIHDALHPILLGAVKRYEDEKRRRVSVNFDDLLSKTYELLCQDEPRRYFSQKYRHFYVDEFQDTDPLQTKIVLLLTSDAPVDKLLEARPRPNALFVVGDPKQSIYRFRRADLRLFDQIEKLAKRDSEYWLHATLRQNFRSAPHLREWFNTTFAPLFSETEAETFIQPMYEPMTGRSLQEVPSVTHEGVYQAHVTEQEEAVWIAQWIRQAVAERWTVRDRGETRPVTYRDFLIVTPTNDMVSYVEALQDAHIPTSFSGQVPVSHFQEVVRLIHLMHYVATRNEMTKRLLLKSGWGIPYSVQDGEALQEAEAVLEKYVTLAKTLPPISWMEVLIYEERIGIFDRTYTEVAYTRALSILTTFLEQVRQAPYVTYSEWATYLFEQLDQSFEYEMTVNAEEHAVRIMNQHKTKGLEASIVILAGASPVKSFPVTHFVERDTTTGQERAHIAHTSNSGWTESIVGKLPTFDSLSIEEMRHIEAERIRLLYVAATRAEQLLLIMHLHDLEKAQTWDLLKEGVPHWDAPLTERQELAVPLRVTPSHYMPSEEVTPSYENISPSTLRSELEHTPVETFDEALFQPVTVPLALQQKEDIVSQPFTGPLWGNIVHALYEHLIRLRPEQRHPSAITPTWCRRAIVEGLHRVELTDDRALQAFGTIQVESAEPFERIRAILEQTSLEQTVHQMALQFIRHPQFSAWLAEGNVYPEWTFRWQLPHNHSLRQQRTEPEVTYMSGIIDLLIERPTGWVIVDYKTDRLEEGESLHDYHDRLRHGYAPQILAYVDVMNTMPIEGSESKSVEAAYIYATRTNTFLPLYEREAEQHLPTSSSQSESFAEDRDIPLAQHLQALYEAIERVEEKKRRLSYSTHFTYFTLCMHGVNVSNYEQFVQNVQAYAPSLVEHLSRNVSGFSNSIRKDAFIDTIAFPKVEHVANVFQPHVESLSSIEELIHWIQTFGLFNERYIRYVEDVFTRTS